MRPLLISAISLSLLIALPGAPEITYIGDGKVTSAADGGLRPAVGVHNVQVFRANRTQPIHQDGLSHTYTHAPMLAYWHGRFYLDFLSAPKSEHEPPSPTSFTSSTDGIHWETPRLLFPSIPLAQGGESLTHQRMSFFVAPNDRLLATAFHGRAPSPNDGTGIGRVVREIKEDGTLGPIHFIRLNQQPGPERTAFPLYSESGDAGFVDACEALLANKLVTAQWWEEDQSDDGYYRLKGKALCIFHRADGAAVAVAKDAQHSISRHEGQTWERLGFMDNIPVNSSKYWAQRTSDGRYALVYNPTTRLRHPLSIVTSSDGKRFDQLLTVHSELPDQRFPGKFKNMGPQYVRGISEGNGLPPDGNLWLTYSVNKEDIWVARVPVPVTPVGSARVKDDFEAVPAGEMPSGWNVYRPLWAPVQVVPAGAQGRALELRDEDPCDYASATRVFTSSRSVVLRFKFLAAQTTGRLEIDVVSAEGLRPVQIALTENGQLEAKHEGIWMSGGAYRKDRWTEVTLRINEGSSVDRFKILVDDQEVLERTAYFSELTPTVERVTFRTGAFRLRGVGGHEIPAADTKAPANVFLIDDVNIESGAN